MSRFHDRSTLQASLAIPIPFLRCRSLCDALLPPQLFLTHSQSLRGESHRYGSGHGRGTLGSIERHSRAYQGHVSERAVRPNGILVEALPTGRIALGVSRCSSWSNLLRRLPLNVSMKAFCDSLPRLM